MEFSFSFSFSFTGRVLAGKGVGRKGKAFHREKGEEKEEEERIIQPHSCSITFSAVSPYSFLFLLLNLQVVCTLRVSRFLCLLSVASRGRIKPMTRWEKS